MSGATCSLQLCIARWLSLVCPLSSSGNLLMAWRRYDTVRMALYLADCWMHGGRRHGKAVKNSCDLYCGIPRCSHPLPIPTLSESHRTLFFDRVCLWWPGWQVKTTTLNFFRRFVRFLRAEQAVRRLISRFGALPSPQELRNNLDCVFCSSLGFLL